MHALVEDVMPNFLMYLRLWFWNYVRRMNPTHGKHAMNRTAIEVKFFKDMKEEKFLAHLDPRDTQPFEVINVGLSTT